MFFWCILQINEFKPLITISNSLHVVCVFPSRKWRASRRSTSSVKTSLTLSPPKCPLTPTRKSRLLSCQVGLWSRHEVGFTQAELPVCCILTTPLILFLNISFSCVSFFNLILPRL